jgi:starvation-inducible DNA-binding protein
LRYKKKVKLKTNIMIKNKLGLDEKKTEQMVSGLNELLANFQIHYQNLRGLHWNIKGKSFFELHVKFEEYYTDAQEKIDIIAERILTLGGVPLHTFKDYTEVSSVRIGKDIVKEDKAVQLIADSLSELLILERNLLNLSDSLNDEGSNALMSDLISEQEKTLWMLNAWLN